MTDKGTSTSKSNVPTKLIDDDERVLCRRVQDGRRLEHLSHERRHTLELTVARADAAENRIEDGQTGAGAGDEGSNLGHECANSRLTDEGTVVALPSAGWSYGAKMTFERTSCRPNLGR